MKLDKKDIETFKGLQGTDMGNWLSDYSKRLIAYMCDIRNMTEKDTPESIQKAASVIEEYFVNKVNKKTSSAKKEVNMFM